MLRLTASYGGHTRRLTLAESGTATLGAAPGNDFVVPFPGVSRRHAQIEPAGDAVALVDLGSKNGLVVGLERRDRVTLRPGDRVQVGRAVLTLEEVSSADLELALVLDPPASPGGASAGPGTPLGRTLEAGETAPHWALHLVREVESLSAGVSEARRTAVLAGFAEAVGASGLWTFAVVEGDLFLRDCVGAVPSDRALGRITDAVLREDEAPPRRPVEIEDSSGRMLICPPLRGGTPVLVTPYPRSRRPELWAADLLVHLAERLRLLEAESPTEDLPGLVEVFLARAAARYGKCVRGMGRRALELLQARRWDGRLRELEHAVEGAVLRCPDGGAVEASHFAELGVPAEVEAAALGTTAGDDTLVTGPFVPLGERLEEAERAAVLEALERASGDRAEAARLLGVGRRSLDQRMARLGLE